FHDFLAGTQTHEHAAGSHTKWELLIMTVTRRRDGLSLLDNLRVCRLVTGAHSRRAAARARVATPGSRRSGRCLTVSFFVDIAHHVRINEYGSHSGGWIKVLHPPSSTYLPRPSDTRASNSGRSCLRQRRFPESRRIDDQRTPPCFTRATPCLPPVLALLTTVIISRGLSGPMTPALIHPGPVIGQPAGWMVLEGFADWRPLWNAQEGCAAARTCVIRRLDRRRGSNARRNDHSHVAHKCTTTFHRSFPYRRQLTLASLAAFRLRT
ncbi:hypothetical protein X777_06910, partial [Ooceraea biroi]